MHAFQLTTDHLRRLNRQVMEHISTRLQSVHPDIMPNEPVVTTDHQGHLKPHERVLIGLSLDGIGFELSVAHPLIQRTAHLCLGGTHPSGVMGGMGGYGLAETTTEQALIEWACEAIRHQGLMLHWERLEPLASQMEGGRTTHVGFTWRGEPLGDLALRLPTIEWRP